MVYHILCTKGLDPKLKRKILKDPSFENYEYELELMTRGKVENPGIFTLKNTDLYTSEESKPKPLLTK